MLSGATLTEAALNNAKALLTEKKVGAVMNLILCVDEGGGMSFFGRRQSMDRVLRQKALALAGEGKLWMDGYTAGQFREEIEGIRVTGDPLHEVPEDGWFFLELGDVAAFLAHAKRLALFRWNRLYISAIVWGCLLSFHVTFWVFFHVNVWRVFLLGIPGQAAIILWFRMYRTPKNKEENKMFPDDEPTLYEQYRQWGIISDEEAEGGLNSTVRAGLLYDTRDKEAAPSRGIWAEAHITMAPKWLGTKIPYYKYSATWRQYFPLVDNDILTLAYRLNYQGTFGKSAPYYVLPYITTMGQSYDRDGMGGFRTIRGIMRNRVQGLDMASYNAEIRWRFTSFTLWNQNISLGLNLFSDGTMVTKEYDMSFKRTVADFESEAAYSKAKSEYDEYMAMGQGGDAPHITVGAGFRFIMNQNFIVCLEYGKPVGKLAKQDGNGAFYINTGYLF